MVQHRTESCWESLGKSREVVDASLDKSFPGKPEMLREEILNTQLSDDMILAVKHNA